MELHFDISRQINHIRRQWRRAVNYKQAHMGFEDSVILNGRVLAYLSYNAERDIFQKDIEAGMGLNKSTVSIMLKELEEKGYIRRESVSSDARLKKLLLTDQGSEAVKKLGSALYEADIAMLKGFTEEEKAILHGYLRRIEDNMREIDITE